MPRRIRSGRRGDDALIVLREPNQRLAEPDEAVPGLGHHGVRRAATTRRPRAGTGPRCTRASSSSITARCCAMNSTDASSGAQVYSNAISRSSRNRACGPSLAWSNRSAIDRASIAAASGWATGSEGSAIWAATASISSSNHASSAATSSSAAQASTAGRRPRSSSTQPDSLAHHGAPSPIARKPVAIQGGVHVIVGRVDPFAAGFDPPAVRERDRAHPAAGARGGLHHAPRRPRLHAGRVHTRGPPCPLPRSPRPPSAADAIGAAPGSGQSRRGFRRRTILVLRTSTIASPGIRRSPVPTSHPRSVPLRTARSSSIVVTVAARRRRDARHATAAISRRSNPREPHRSGPAPTG